MAAAEFGRSLARFRSRAAAASLVVLLATLASAWATAWLAAVLVVAVVPPPGTLAALLLGTAAAGGCVASAVVGLRYLRSLSLPALPSRVEARIPEAAGIITTAATLGRRPGEELRRLGVSEDLGRALGVSAARILSEAPAGLLVSRRDLGSPIRLLAAAAVGLLAAGLLDPPLPPRALGSLLRPVRALPSPVSGMRVVPASAVVLSGGALTVRAVSVGSGPASADLLVSSAGVEPRRIAMRRLGGGVFEARLADLRAAATYRAEAAGLVSDEGRVTIEPMPGLADIEVTVRPPAYTGLPERTRPGGAVEALRGSAITVRGRGVKPVASGEIAFSDGARRPLAVEGSRVEYAWNAAASGWYRLSVTDHRGNLSPPGLDYPVTVTEDRPPVVLLDAPGGDLELDGLEPIVVAGKTTDDFGITGLAVRYRLPEGEERTVALPLTRRGGTEAEGTATIDLPSLPVSPGERVTLWMEARDNDAVAGPKVGASRQVVVLVRDPALARKALEEAEKRVADELVNALADGLEQGAKLDPGAEPPTERQTRMGAFADGMKERMDRASSDIDALAEAASRNPRTPMSDLEELDALAEQVRKISEKASGMPRAEASPGTPQGEDAKERVEEMTRALEQAASLADQLPRRRNLRDAVEKGEDLANAQNRLLDALQKMEDRPSAEVDQAVRDALAKISDLLAQLGEILSRAPEKLPEEFVNKDAMREFDLNSLAKELAEIASLARQGKASEARAKAEALAKQLANLLASLREGKDEMDRLSPEEMAEEMDEQDDVLGKMIEEQRSILDETQKIQNRVTRDLPAEAMRRRDEGLAELERRREELARAVERLRRDLEEKPLLRSSVGEVARNVDEVSRRLTEELKAGRPVDMPGAGEEIERGVADMETLSGTPTSPEALERERQGATESLAGAARAGRDFREAMRKLSPDPKAMVTPAEKETLSGLSRRQGTLQRQAAGIAERLERLSALVPTIDRDAVEGMRSAASEMSRAQAALGGGDPLEAAPPERAALSGLQKGKAGLQASAGRMRRMARMSGVRIGDGAGRNPGGLFPSLRLGMKPRTGKEEGGRMGVSTREFAIPKAEEFVPEPGLRESLQRSRGGVVPPAYRDQVEEYYDRLSNR